MKPDELMTIGRFARLSGVSVHALRHYDDVGRLTSTPPRATAGTPRASSGWRASSGR
jgi:DNA-binding transcriptional MerR regulator